jgi:putative flippase GtrA
MRSQVNMKIKSARWYQRFEYKVRKIGDLSEAICSSLGIDFKFIKFLIVGGINTLFGYLMFALFIFLGFHFTLAAFLATIAGIIFNFNTTGKLVFNNRDNRLILKFVAVYAIIYLINILFLKVFDIYHVNMLIAGAVLILPMAMIAFALNKHFVFNRNETN